MVKDMVQRMDLETHQKELESAGNENLRASKASNRKSIEPAMVDIGEHSNNLDSHLE